MTTTELMAAWRKRHAAEWALGGNERNAELYAFVVAENRLGGRTSLTWSGSLAYERAGDLAARKLIREQVDACFHEIMSAPGKQR